MPAAEWNLDPATYDDVWALRDRLPRRASWYCSPEPKALETAQLLTDADVGIVEDLREHERGGEWFDDFPAVVRRAFAEPADRLGTGPPRLGGTRDAGCLDGLGS